MTNTMGEASYAVGSIVWVKLTGGKWWPGEVVAQDSCPEEVTKGLRKEPLAIVKFFDEDFYELVKSSSHIHPFVCAKRDEFIRKGRELLKYDPNAEKFDKDVEEAMHLCGVTNEDQSDCSNSFDNTSLSNHYEPLPSKNMQNYGSAMVASSPSQCKPLASRIQYGDYKTIEFDSGTDVRIRAQPSPASISKGAAYACDMCSFQTNRIANIIVHHKSHSEQLRLLTYKIGSVKERGAFSDERGSRNKDSKLTLQKVKRKIFTDSDQESKVKRKPKKTDGGNEGLAVAGVDVTGSQKKRSHQVVGPDGTPVPKRKRKKETDPDTIFDKMKKQSAKKMSRKRGSGGYVHAGSLSSQHNLKGLSKRKDGSDGSSDEAEFLISRGVYDGDEGVEGEELSTLRSEEGVDNEHLPESLEETAQLKSLEEKEMIVDNVNSQTESLTEPVDISEAIPATTMEYNTLTEEEDLPVAHSSEIRPVEADVAEPLHATEEVEDAVKEGEDTVVLKMPEDATETIDEVSVEKAKPKLPFDRVATSDDAKIASPGDQDLFFLDREPDKEDIFESDETKNDVDAYLDTNANETQEEEFMQIESPEKEQSQSLSDEVVSNKVEEILLEDDLVVIPEKKDLKILTEKEEVKKEEDYFTVEDMDTKLEPVPVSETCVEKAESLIIDEASLESERDVTEESDLMHNNKEIVTEKMAESVDLMLKDSEEVEREDDRLSEKNYDVIIDYSLSEKDEEIVEERVEKESDVSVAETSFGKETEVIAEEGFVEVEDVSVEERFSGPCTEVDSIGVSQNELGINDAVHLTKSDNDLPLKEVEEVLQDEAVKENDIEVASSPESAQDIFAEEEIIEKADGGELQEKIIIGTAIDDDVAEASSTANVPERESSSQWEFKDSDVVMTAEDERPAIASEELVVEEHVMDVEETIHDNAVVDKVMEEIVEVTSSKSKDREENIQATVVPEASANVVAEVEMNERLKNTSTVVDVITSLPDSGSGNEKSAEPKLMPLPHSYPRVVDLTTLEHEAIILSEGVVTDSSIIANIPIPPDPSTDSTLLANIPIPPDPAPVCVLPPQLTCQLSPVAEEPQVLEYTKLEALMQPQEMEPVYLEPVMDVPIVEGEEIIHIGNEQVIGTSMDVFCNEVVIESDDKEVQEEYDNICLVTDEDRMMMASSEVAISQKMDDDKITKFGVQERQSSEIMMSTADAINGTLAQTIIGGSVRTSSVRDKAQPTEIGHAR